MISQADGLLITAGAGMGIDSGLPDFRGDHGFWKAYPALGNLGMRFYEVANPKAFESMPEVATKAICGMSSIDNFPSGRPSEIPFDSSRAATRCAGDLPSPINRITFLALRGPVT